MQIFGRMLTRIGNPIVSIGNLGTGRCSFGHSKCINVLDIFKMYEYEVFKYVFTHMKAVDLRTIHGVPGGMCQTSGECSVRQTIPI